MNAATPNMPAFEQLLAQTCVFEVDAVDVDRFFVAMLEMPVAPRLILVDQPDEYAKYRAGGRFKDADVRCTAWMTVRELTALLREQGIRYLLIDAHRIPDVHMVLAARDAGCRVLYIQHGMYIPFMKRTLGFFFQKSLKTLRYLYYAFDSGRHMKRLGLAWDLFRIHVLGARRDLVREHRHLFPDAAGAFSRYWCDWHVTHYAFPRDVMLEMGSPDLRKLRFGPPLGDDAVAYCYQTLVEDGRIAPEAMQSFYRELKAWADRHGKRVVVRAHPRGRADLVAPLRDELGFEIVTADIPDTALVIGHYSSLLAYWGVKGRQVACVTLPGHPVHESIAPWATVVDSLAEVDPAKGVATDATRCREYFGDLVPLDDVRAALYGI